MYTMKEACEKTGLAYETLKFYCNQGLVPNVKRDSQNRRIFDDRDIAWINSLNCLKNCNMGIAEMKEYLALCLQGEGQHPRAKDYSGCQAEVFGRGTQAHRRGDSLHRLETGIL